MPQAAGSFYGVWCFSLLGAYFFAILVGIPLVLALPAGVVQQPRSTHAALVLGAIPFVFCFLLFLVAAAAVWLLGKDFMAPVMAVEKPRLCGCLEPPAGHDEKGEGLLRWLHRDEDRAGNRGRHFCLES